MNKEESIIDVYFVSRILYKIDPVDLVSLGVPVNEYDGEAKRIIDKILELSFEERYSQDKVVNIVTQVFDKMFEHVSMRRETFTIIAAEIISFLKK